MLFRKTSPVVPVDNPADGPGRHAVPVGQCRWPHVSKFSDFSHLLFGEFRPAVRLPLRNSALAIRILAVLLASTQEQVLWIDARGSIAVVADLQTFGNASPAVFLPRDPVRAVCSVVTHGAIPNPDSSVPVWSATPGPDAALCRQGTWTLDAVSGDAREDRYDRRSHRMPFTEAFGGQARLICFNRCRAALF